MKNNSDIYFLSLSILVNFVTIQSTLGALALFELSDIHVLLVSNAPQHSRVGAIRARLPKAIHISAGVLALTVRPDVVTSTVSQIVLECSLEGALVLFELDFSFSVQLSILIPCAGEGAGTNFDYTWAGEFALCWYVVSRSGPISHRQNIARLQGILVPNALNLGDIALIVEEHLTLTMQLISFDLAHVTDACFLPLYIEMTVHLLVFKGALIYDRSLLISAFVPLAVAESALEPSLNVRLRISDPALRHCTFQE